MKDLINAFRTVNNFFHSKKTLKQYKYNLHQHIHENIEHTTITKGLCKTNIPC